MEIPKSQQRLGVDMRGVDLHGVVLWGAVLRGAKAEQQHRPGITGVLPRSPASAAAVPAAFSSREGGVRRCWVKICRLVARKIQ